MSDSAPLSRMMSEVQAPVCVGCGRWWVRGLAVVFVVAVAAGAVSPGVWAQVQVGPAVVMVGEDEADEKKAPPSLDEVTEGFTVVNNTEDGRSPTLFTVYRKEDRVLALIPKGLLDRPWLLGASVAAGPFSAGEQIGSTALEWRRRGKRLDLYEPELRYTADTKPTLIPGVRDVYTDRYIASATILAERDGDALIDLTAFMSANLETFAGTLYGSVNLAAQRLEKIKAFPMNVELAVSAPVNYARFGYSGPLNGRVQTLHFSFSGLRDNPDFTRRPADPRVGFWVHATRDLGRRDPLGTDRVRSIERWDLRKSAPDARLSPPNRPIVFYIEKTVPRAYRVAVRRGVEAWNEAFREVGIDHAIEVRQQTETQYATLDPEDIRYNFVRWTPSGGGYAIALHRTDPRTGEILDADVVIDDGWVNAWVDELPLLTQDAVAARFEARRRASPGLGGVLDRVESAAAARGLLRGAPGESVFDRAPGVGGSGVLPAELADVISPGVLNARVQSGARCAYARRLGLSMAMAHLAWLTGPDADDDEDEDEDEDADEDEDSSEGAGLLDGVPETLVTDNLTALVAHEVGHVLGLRHNFASSAWRPADAIDGYTDPSAEPIAGSVMDYIGTLIADVDTPQGLYNMTRIGPYDRWAIAYGYMPGDEDALRAHLARSVEPAHRYMTDEDVYTIDPTAMRYDFGADPVQGRGRQLRRIDYVRGRLLDRLAREGQSWEKVRTAFNALWFEELFALWDTTVWIGGTYLSRDFNTPGARPPMVNVEPARQRGVLRLLVDRLFSESSFTFDRDVLNAQQTVRWLDSNFPENWWLAYGGDGDVSVLSRANLAQFLVLSDLMYWNTPRLANQEIRTDPSADALTLPEMHETLTGAIWSEFDREPPAGRQARSNLDPVVSALRRALQREHADQLVSLAYRFGSMPATFASAQLVAVDQLREIRRRLTPWAEAGVADRLDDYTRIHVRETLALIDATLEAQVVRQP